MVILFTVLCFVEFHIIQNITKQVTEQAGAELGQAQVKLKG